MWQRQSYVVIILSSSNLSLPLSAQKFFSPSFPFQMWHDIMREHHSFFLKKRQEVKVNTLTSNTSTNPEPTPGTLSLSPTPHFLFSSFRLFNSSPPPSSSPSSSLFEWNFVLRFSSSSFQIRGFFQRLSLKWERRVIVCWKEEEKKKIVKRREREDLSYCNSWLTSFSLERIKKQRHFFFPMAGLPFSHICSSLSLSLFHPLFFPINVTLILYFKESDESKSVDCFPRFYIHSEKRRKSVPRKKNLVNIFRLRMSVLVRETDFFRERKRQRWREGDE